jgi:hypothetical protein
VWGELVEQFYRLGVVRCRAIETSPRQVVFLGADGFRHIPDRRPRQEPRGCSAAFSGQRIRRVLLEYGKPKKISVLLNVPKVAFDLTCYADPRGFSKIPDLFTIRHIAQKIESQRCEELSRCASDLLHITCL